MRADELRPALLEVLRPMVPASGSPQLPAVWTGVQRWMAMPRAAAGAAFEFEGFLVDREEVDGSAEPPSGISSEYVCCLEFMRTVPDGPAVGVGLYYPADDAWWEVALILGWSEGLRFVAECRSADPGELDRFVANVEDEPWFHVASGRRAQAVIVFDTDESPDIRLGAAG